MRRRWSVLQEPFLLTHHAEKIVMQAKCHFEDIVKLQRPATRKLNLANRWLRYDGRDAERTFGGERQRVSIARAILHDPRF